MPDITSLRDACPNQARHREAILFSPHPTKQPPKHKTTQNIRMAYIQLAYSRMASVRMASVRMAGAL
ncbi:MAG: hypothetical protein K2I61_07825 [Muribaculaceae bacterium]|nr:hypothetical protein [Muribaculaceae bacterium]